MLLRNLVELLKVEFFFRWDSCEIFFFFISFKKLSAELCGCARVRQMKPAENVSTNFSIVFRNVKSDRNSGISKLTFLREF